MGRWFSLLSLLFLECYEVRLAYNRTSDVCIQVIEERSVSATFNIIDIPFVPTYLLLPL